MPTRIEWATETWNPVTGCSPVSPGCDHCYAARMSKRLAGRCGYPADEPFRVTTHPGRLGQPLRWKKPRRIFVCSMGDLFHKDVPFEYIAAIFGVMTVCSQHIFMLLTKRPDRALKWYEWYEGLSRAGCSPMAALYAARYHVESVPIQIDDEQWPLPNVWIGVTAEDQQRADERIPTLLQIPAAVRFVSVEPMLGPVDSEAWFAAYDRNGEPCGPRNPAVDWVICGAETGPGKREMKNHWASDLACDCGEAGVPFFFKKDSEGKHTLDGNIWEQFPGGVL